MLKSLFIITYRNLMLYYFVDQSNPYGLMIGVLLNYHLCSETEDTRYRLSSLSKDGISGLEPSLFPGKVTFLFM